MTKAAPKSKPTVSRAAVPQKKHEKGRRFDHRYATRDCMSMQSNTESETHTPPGLPKIRCRNVSDFVSLKLAPQGAFNEGS